MRLLQIISIAAFLIGVGSVLHAQRLQVISTRFYCNGHKETFNRITDVIQTKDKGFAFVGATSDSGGGIMSMCVSVGRHAVMGKLDSLGNVQWIKNQCDVGLFSTSICQTPDGGYAVNGGIVTPGGIHIFRYDSAGNFLWKKEYGQYAVCGTQQILATSDHGFLLLGACQEQDADIPYNYQWPPLAFQPVDWVVMKLDGLGNKQWVRVLGTSGDEEQATLTTDGIDYYLIGSTNSKDHDCADTANHPGPAIYAIKLDKAGNTVWTRAFGKGYPRTSMFDSRDNTIMIAGRTWGNGHEFTGHLGYDDMFLVKLDTMGNYIWGTLFGTADFNEFGNGVCKGADNSYLMVGDGYDNSGKASGFLLSIDSSGKASYQKIITGDGGGIALLRVFPVGGEFATLGLTSSTKINEGTGQNCPYNSIGSGALTFSRLQSWKAGVSNTPNAISTFTIAPNPAHSSFELRFMKRHFAGQFTCINSAGKVVFRQELDVNTLRTSIPTDNWLPGNYIVCWQATGDAESCQPITIH